MNSSKGIGDLSITVTIAIPSPAIPHRFINPRAAVVSPHESDGRTSG